MVTYDDVETEGHEDGFAAIIIAGGTAGMLHQVCTYPIDVVKSHIQVQPHHHNHHYLYSEKHTPGTPPPSKKAHKQVCKMRNSSSEQSKRPNRLRHSMITGDAASDQTVVQISRYTSFLPRSLTDCCKGTVSCVLCDDRVLPILSLSFFSF